MVVCTNLPVAGGNKLFVCCVRQTVKACGRVHGDGACSMVRVGRPGSPAPARAVHRRSASAQRAPTQGPASTNKVGPRLSSSADV